MEEIQLLMEFGRTLVKSLHFLDFEWILGLLSFFGEFPAA